MYIIFYLEKKNELLMDFFLDYNPEQVIDMTSKESGQIANVFNAIDKNLSSELVSKIGAIYKFNVKGNFIPFILI